MNDDDIQLFHEMIGAARGEVRRLKHPAKTPAHKPPPSPKLRARSHPHEHEIAPNPLSYFSDHDPYAPLTHEAEASSYARTEFHRASISQQTLRRLRQGKLAMAATLDLHGCPVEEARQRVAWLLQQPASGRYPGEALCVRIIHGQGYNSPRGQGKLKRLLQIWLPQSERVLAYCTARPIDGGQGAVYVLLRGDPA